MPLDPDAIRFLEAHRLSNRPAWPDMPLSEARETFRTMEHLFGSGPELRRVDDVIVCERIPCRIYEAHPPDTTGTLMFFHGGGWVLGDIVSHDAVCRRLAAESGLAVVSVDYRLAPEHRAPAALDDCFAATQHVVRHAQQLRLSTDRLIVGGDSAGGNLAAAVALKARDTANFFLTAQLLIYPVLDHRCSTSSYAQFAEGHGLTRDTMDWFWEQYLGDQTPTPYLSPTMADSLADLPPAHIVTAEYDVLRDEASDYADQLRAAGVPVTYQQYDGVLHGFMHFTGAFQKGLTATQDVAQVLRNF